MTASPAEPLRIADLVDDDPSRRDRVSAALKDPAQKRNEAFDIRNYATAALEIGNPPGLEIPGEDAPRPAKPQHQYRRRRSGGI